MLVLTDCVALTEIADHLDVIDLDLSGCVSFGRWPASLPARMGRLTLAGCESLTELPPTLRRVAELDVSGCASLRRVPRDLVVDRWLEVAGAPLEEVPEGAALLYRGVRVPADVVLRPEAITFERVVEEPNAELRRVLIERMGYARFAAEAAPRVLDEDRDAGGPRQLLRIELRPSEEPLVCVAVRCPSTGHRYLLRVPPTTTTCHQAAAWLAGFDDPAEYAPVKET